MAESLREEIARLTAKLKSSQQSSPAPVQASKPMAKPKVVEVPQETEAEDEYVDEDDEEIPVQAEKVSPMPQKQEIVGTEKPSQEETEAEAQKIMFLQDNGIFRSELLNILKVIAGVLVEMNGKNKN